MTSTPETSSTPPPGGGAGGGDGPTWTGRSVIVTVVILVGLMVLIGGAVWFLSPLAGPPHTVACLEKNTIALPEHPDDRQRLEYLKAGIACDLDDLMGTIVSNKVTYYVLTAAGLIFGLIVSVGVALDWTHTRSKLAKGILVALPLLSTAASNSIVQFKIAEEWQLRATGVNDLRAIHAKLFAGDPTGASYPIAKAYQEWLEVEKAQYGREQVMAGKKEEPKTGQSPAASVPAAAHKRPNRS